MAQFVKLLNEANYNIGKKHTIKFTYFLFLWPNQWLTCSLQCVLSFSSHHMSYDVDILGFRVILSQTSTHNLEPKLYFRYFKEYFQFSGFWQQGKKKIILDQNN